MRMEIGRSNIKGKWLFSKTTDLLLLFIPVWLVWAVFLILGDRTEHLNLPLWGWIIFILGVDVSHVWSSIFRSYGDRSEFKAHKWLFILTPLIVFLFSYLLLSYSVLWFWRIMAYFAVFHFIKQQYGFTALYQAKIGKPKKRWFSDKFIIYFSTLYPVMYWHFNSKSSFNWFIEHDFFALHYYLNLDIIPWLWDGLNLMYWSVIIYWGLKEIKACRSNKSSVGKIFWVLTTALNWWLGIVYFNSDLVFSISNVVAHGIPYIVLIYFYRLRKSEKIEELKFTLNKKLKWLLVLLSVIMLAALIEEYFWDMLVYREHSHFFEAIYPYHFEQLSNLNLVALGTALLALPQQVHYVIDGFIWKFNAKNPFVLTMFKSNES